MEIAVNAAYTKFAESFDIYNTQKKSVTLATENYDVVNKRYLNDLVLITDNAQVKQLITPRKLARARLYL